MNQCFTYAIPPHAQPFPATADRICVAEPRPHTSGVRHLPCGSLTTEPCRPTACNPCGYPRLTARYSLFPANSTDATPAPPAHPILNSSFFILNWTYTFSAKERDSETGLSYFGSRYYSSDLSVWLSVDPMSDKYPSLSPYVYCADNPVKLVDPNGLYPKSILSYNPSLGLHGGYKLKQSAAHLLSLVSGVSQELIESTVIQKRAAGQYRPLYSCNSGGGAITVGTLSYTTITFTENWFEDNPNKYEGNGYGFDVVLWLDLLSHEVGHLPQIKREGGLFPYLFSFAKEYIQYGHDDAPSEVEAENLDVLKNL